MSLLNDALLKRIEVELDRKLVLHYDDSSRLLSDVRRLREAIAKVPLSFDSDEDGGFWYTCQFCNEESDESEGFSHADNCIYLEVVQGGK